ncbi:MAG TPA: cbb3-type cytochrome c oxidase subunit 3 [Gemmatimonadaceae bacterium]|jgi:cbb3-type cytochrome oxidase subunit 3|nr:cbb3-type cytochrome c oxidase subunit 3 [Gemmatimonadaceae bacterium]
MKSLTDVVSGAGLSIYAEVALVIFLIAFLGIVISLYAPGRQRMYERLRHLPIDGENDTALSVGTMRIPPFVAGAPLGRRLTARDDTRVGDDSHA